jgi:hypothetical protein
MIGGIASLVQGERRRKLGVSMWLAHTGLGITGGVGMAALVWLLLTPLRTIPPEPVVIAIFLGISAAAVLAELNLIPMPRQARQVPQWWYGRYGPTRSYALYGLWLGAGLATNVTYTLEFVIFAAAGLLLPLPQALVVGLAFGFARTAFVGPLGLVPGAAGWWSRQYASGRRGRILVSCCLSVGMIVGVVLTMM